MSRRDEAVLILVEMLGADDDKDKITAADKILRSENIERAHIDRAVKVLESIMRDTMAEPRNRVSAADKLKNFAAPRSQTKQDMARVLAGMTNDELRAIVDSAQLDPGIDPLLC